MQGLKTASHHNQNGGMLCDQELRLKDDNLGLGFGFLIYFTQA